MNFHIQTAKIFLEQLSKLSKKSKKLVQEKIILLKENPFRFKRIHSKKFNKVFRIRLNLDGKESRLIYAVIEPNIIIVCLLDRNKNYTDLEKYLKKI